MEAKNSSVGLLTCRIIVDVLEMFQGPRGPSGSFIPPSLPLFVLKPDSVITLGPTMVKAYLDSALFLCSSLKVTFPDALGNAIPQTPTLPFTLLLD